MVFFGWKTIVAFSVPDDVAAKGYYVGFTANGGKSSQKRTVQHDSVFSMKVGREGCLFWVKAIDGSCLIAPQVIGRGPLH